MQGPLPDGGGIMPAGMDESPAWSRWMRAALRAGACASEGFWDHRSRLRTAPFPSATDELAVRDPRFSSPDPWLPRELPVHEGFEQADQHCPHLEDAERDSGDDARRAIGREASADAQHAQQAHHHGQCDFDGGTDAPICQDTRFKRPG